MASEHVLLINVDGLRPDVFAGVLQAGRLPHIARLFGGQDLRRGLMVKTLAPAPSITFASQACLITGQHPSRHGIPGNQFFDRFGQHSQGTPRHYAFDVGDMLAFDDAVRVFTDGLAARCLQAPTLFELPALRGRRSAVIGYMYANGASAWHPPSVVQLARFTKGGNLLGLDAADFDRYLLEKALDYLAEDGVPELFLMYFMGVDTISHQRGPHAQGDYLTDVIDPMVGELWDAFTDRDISPRCVFCSDHGQIGVPAEDRHSLRLGFPFEREMSPLFDALGLDVHDFPGEDPNVDAVVASNGGIAHVYLQNRRERWADPPDFDRDVLPVGRAFWEGHTHGKYAPELAGSLASVLVRDVAKNGWESGYHALNPEGEIVSLSDWFAGQPADIYRDPVHRLNNLAGPCTGDLLLISNYPQGYYFAAPMSGVHGGLHPDDSLATLAYGWPSASQDEWDAARAAIGRAIDARCRAEEGREPSTADMITGLLAMLG